MVAPFSSLAAEYANLLAQAQPTRHNDIIADTGRLLVNIKQNKYKAVADQLKIPQIFIATSFDREASSDFSKSPAQGDPWNTKSVNVPKGLGPYKSWTEAALDAYRYDGIDNLPPWTWSFFCYIGERFNGFGYRQYGANTPYLWSGSTVYRGGKYVSDGKYRGDVFDKQLGIVAVARAIIRELPELDLPGWPQQRPTPAGFPAQVPEGVGGGKHNTAWIQESLNAILKLDPPLVVDNNYGRNTMAAVRQFQKQAQIGVDGLVGPETFAALDDARAVLVLAPAAQSPPGTSP